MMCTAEKTTPTLKHSQGEEDMADSFTDLHHIKYRYILFIMNLLIMNIATGLIMIMISQMETWNYYRPFLDIYMLGVGCTMFGACIVICSVTMWANYIVYINRESHYQYFNATLMSLLSFLIVLSFIGYLCYDKSIEIVTSMIQNAMRDYPKNPIIAHSIDKMQVTLKCCGLHDLSDWFATPSNAVPISCCPVETSSGKHTHCPDNSLHRDSCLIKLIEVSMNGITEIASFVGILVFLMGIAMVFTIKLTRLSKFSSAACTLFSFYVKSGDTVVISSHD